MIKKVQNLDIEGVELYEIESFNDNRGNFKEIYISNLKFNAFNIDYVQENESLSDFGVFRGMHFQKNGFSQSKLIRIIKGKALDFICDLRRSSSTFKKIIKVNLDNNKILFLPKGLAHGFLSLEEGTILNYKCDNFYNLNSESGFNLFKSGFDFDFEIDKKNIFLSDKDKNLPDLKNSYFYKNL